MSKKDQEPRKASDSGLVEEDDLVFKPDAISSLTKKIEANLKSTQNGKLLQRKGNKPKEVGKKQAQKEGGKRSTPIDREGPKPAHNAQNGITGQSSTAQGKKRSRDGLLKDSKRATSQPNGVQKSTKTHNLDPEQRSKLEEEVLALGGTKDDLKLIEDDLSESEFEGDAPSKQPALKGLKKELLHLVQELGIEKVPQEADEDSESGQDEGNAAALGRKNTVSETPGGDASMPQTIKSRKGFPQYQIEPTSEWHAVPLPALTSPDAKVVALPPDLITRVHEYAKSLLDAENERYASQTGSANSAQQFYSTIMSSGTLSDKISALTLSVQESPLHNVRALEALVGLARKRSRGQAVEVLGALKDLFGIGSVLPADRKLRTFAAQPDLLAAFASKMKWTSDDDLPKSLTRAHLALWAFEDWLKALFFEILKILETWCNDEVVFARGKAVDYVCQLLKEKPEQEANLLRLLVNKLGDKDKKIASKTSYHILQLETAHPLMKPTIISAIESDLLFRPGQSLHAQYYAIITLNQTILSGKEEHVAKKLLDIYFSLFAKLLAKPQAPKPEAIPVKINQKGEIQGGGGPAGRAARHKAALKENATAVEDDLREKMLSAILTGVNRAVPYANTKYEIFEKHMDTLFRVTHSSNFNTSIQALMLIQQLNETHQGSVDRFYRTLYESLLDPRLLTSSKQALYLNLLFKSLRSDLKVKRVKAFAKRLLQVVSMHQPAFACGAMYLLRELEGIFANLSSSVDDREQDDSDEEEEVFHDIQDNANNATPSPPPPIRANPQQIPQAKKKTATYDPRKRDPEHSNADRSPLWELLPFRTHYHPSVSLFASRLLTHSPMPPKPDLQTHTLIHFLDRFVYRNPKTNIPARGASIMQPLLSSSSSSSFLPSTINSSNLLSSTPSLRERNKQPVNTEAFWKQEAENVRPDEVFFHRYFCAVGRGRERAKSRKEKKKGKGKDDEEDGEEEEEIWKALVGSRPEIEGEEGEEEEEEESFDADELDEEMAGDEDDEEMPDFGQDEEEDEEALLGSDEDVPMAFLREAAQEGKKGKGGKNEERKAKRMKLKQLPVFAEADEYREVLEEGEGEGEVEG
ncbi:MAG: hypothetical protein LQ338_003950 [Usnochroma carphineum]|nr:MAG: hypothetical protein LQ338_003950 [Usnochroma carphineum]